MNEQIGSSKSSDSIGIPHIRERGNYSVENFSTACKTLSELPDGILFLRLASKDGIICYEFSNAIHKSHYTIQKQTIYSEKTNNSYSPPTIGRISGYIFALFQEEEKKWLIEDLEGKYRRYVFTMRIKDGKIEKIIKEKCVKRATRVISSKKTNTERVDNILGSSISKLPNIT